MTVELWLGREYDHTHEMKALGQFLARMDELYGQDDADAHRSGVTERWAAASSKFGLYPILANFFCQGEEIDLAVLKRDGISPPFHGMQRRNGQYRRMWACGPQSASASSGLKRDQTMSKLWIITDPSRRMRPPQGHNRLAQASPLHSTRGKL